ncbi:hypothetical protein C0J08_04680 [Marinomonas sp. CT5]|uniref:hypothetical protein n=1 Tax=Marinomonas sp. CT5 TaxID=2066133 RepID=UPI001BAEB43E|nr:hypothetical protein [Marinomonas sp. CT5]QUX94744.1 hypothetical protein C0J08_04680 [Marinomonas sp. CT5]
MLWLVLALAYVALLQIFWMPAFWRALLYLSVGLGGLVLMVQRFRQPLRKIGIDDQGGFIFDLGVYERLLFIRANSLQLIAKVDKEKSLFRRVWPKYRVIYRDSLSSREYKILRSYAAQQILLRRSEEAKNH